MLSPGWSKERRRFPVRLGLLLVFLMCFSRTSYFLISLWRLWEPQCLQNLFNSIRFGVLRRFFCVVYLDTPAGRVWSFWAQLVHSSVIVILISLLFAMCNMDVLLWDGQQCPFWQKVSLLSIESMPFAKIRLIWFVRSFRGVSWEHLYPAIRVWSALSEDQMCVSEVWSSVLCLQRSCVCVKG